MFIKGMTEPGLSQGFLSTSVTFGLLSWGLKYIECSIIS